jgi:SulP family sulfate permease
MEAISIAKAMAARTRQRLDANQELIGQGLSNMVSGCFSGYPGSGSFSRSAVNINAGAITGVSSVVTGLVVGITLLWLTPLLYHLPQATLAAVIIMAVVNLIKIEPVIHAWKAQPHDGIVAVVTFILTLAMAPHLDKGIIVGVALSIGLFLFRSMRPRVAVLSRYQDGTMRDISVHTQLVTSPKISIIRFDGSLYFANAGYFESKILEVVAANPELRYIIVDGQGINQLDATGEEVLHHLAERLKSSGIELLVARMKKQFMDTIRKTKLLEAIGEERFFSRIQFALDFAWDGLGSEYDRTKCPLRNPKM